MVRPALSAQRMTREPPRTVSRHIASRCQRQIHGPSPRSAGPAPGPAQPSRAAVSKSASGSRRDPTRARVRRAPAGPPDTGRRPARGFRYAAQGAAIISTWTFSGRAGEPPVEMAVHRTTADVISGSGPGFLIVLPRGHRRGAEGADLGAAGWDFGLAWTDGSEGHLSIASDEALCDAQRRKVRTSRCARNEELSGQHRRCAAEAGARRAERSALATRSRARVAVAPTCRDVAVSISSSKKWRKPELSRSSDISRPLSGTECVRYRVGNRAPGCLAFRSDDLELVPRRVTRSWRRDELPPSARALRCRADGANVSPRSRGSPTRDARPGVPGTVRREPQAQYYDETASVAISSAG